VQRPNQNIQRPTQPIQRPQMEQEFINRNRGNTRTQNFQQNRPMPTQNRGR
jgi:hypothetical protein